MAQERLSVRKIRDLLRLHLVGGVKSRRQLGGAVGCSKTAVSDCLRRAAVAGLNSWEAVAELDEEELERRLYPSARAGGAPLGRRRGHSRIGPRCERNSPDAITR